MAEAGVAGPVAEGVSPPVAVVVAVADDGVAGPPVPDGVSAPVAVGVAPVVGDDDVAPVVGDDDVAPVDNVTLSLITELPVAEVAEVELDDFNCKATTAAGSKA